MADEEPILSLKIILRIENSIYATVLNRFFYTVLTLGNGSLNPSFVVLVYTQDNVNATRTIVEYQCQVIEALNSPRNTVR